ncbi:MAG: hypothetical protein LBS99_03045 [Clostridiales bacterium]|jgi:uncharacterized protein YxjI|nr:hypothetical protein [Clostridiales bacterium]
MISDDERLACNSCGEGGDKGFSTFYLKQKVFSIGEKFNFFDADQNVLYRSTGSFFSIPKEFTLFKGEAAVTRIVRKVFSWLPQYEVIDIASGNTLAVMKQRFSFRQNFDITTGDGPLQVEGTVFGYSFSIRNPSGQTLVRTEKELLSWGDAYRIETDARTITTELALSLIIAYDNAVHDGKD